MKINNHSQELSYQESGRGSAVILVHAFPLHRALWSSTVRALSPRFHVLAPDLPGFGESPLAATPKPSIDLYTDQLVALCEHKHIKKATWVGCSMGGYILFNLQKRYPSLLKGLVLVDTKAAADPAEAARAREENATRIEQSNPQDFYESMLARLLGATTLRERPGAVAAVRRMMQEASPEGVATALRAMAQREDSTSRLSSISTQTLVIAGEEDQITPAAEAKQMAASMPNASFISLPKAGHLPSIETPEPFQQALLSFLAKLS